jgi:hypothetical protein
MSFDSLLIHRLVIERPYATGAGDDYNQPVREPEDLLAIDARVDAKDQREIALQSQAGADVGDYTIFMRPTDLLTSDRFRWADDNGDRFEIVGITVRDAATPLHHYEVDARLLRSAEPVPAGS